MMAEQRSWNVCCTAVLSHIPAHHAPGTPALTDVTLFAGALKLYCSSQIIVEFGALYMQSVGRESVVGMTRYWMGGPGVESR